MFNWLRQRALPVHQVIEDYQAVPAPTLDQPVAEVRFLVVDFETTGLIAKKHHIVSVGWVEIVGQAIELGRCEHFLVKPPVSVGQSAIFHGLHDKDLSHALELEDVLTKLLTRAAGAVLVAHHAQLEQSFLEVACQRCFGKKPRFQFLDTMRLEWNRLQQQGKVITAEALRLPNCLARHHLPIQQHHHAQEDAYSAALLLLSQIKQTRDTKPRLADLWKLNQA